MTKQFDALLTHLGMGRWNLIGIVLFGFWAMQVPANSFGGAFLTPVLEHSCKIPDDGSPVYVDSATNDTVIDTCWYLRNTSDSVEKLPCTDWDFDNSTYITTITSEFKLVCDREYLRPTFQSIYFLGGLIASSFAGILSDNYGRKTVTTVGIVVYSITANCINWLPNLSSIVAARFILGLMHPTSLAVSYTLALEKSPPCHRATVGLVGYLPWIFGAFIWAGEGYLIREWRWLMFAAPLPSILAIVLLCFVDESPRWLIVKGHHKRALRVLRRAARWNRTTLPSEDKLLALMKEIEHEANKGEKPKIEGSQRPVALVRSIGHELLLLFRTPVIRRITLALYCINVVIGMVYYGLSLSGGNLGTDPYVYMALSSVMEIPANTVTVPLVSYLGRKRSNIMFFFMTGGALLLLVCVPKGWAATTLAMIGKVTITAAYAVMYFHASELFPTEVRDKGMGTTDMLAKTGSILVPYLINALGSRYWWAPSVICGGASILAGGMYFLLMETLGKSLPDTVKELEAYHSSEKRTPATDTSGTSNSANKEETFPLSA